MTRQSAGLLPGTLESIFRQDWPEVEVIVLDRASEDGTLEMLREGDGAIDYWRSAPDDGEYDAINAAAQLASGRYVMFIRAGDVLHSRDALSLALDEAPDDADVITGHHVQRHVAGRDELRQSGDFGRTWALLRRGEVDWSWLSRVPAQQATLIRAEILRRNPYRSDLRVAADLELLCRLAARGGRFHHSMAVLATTGTGWCKDQRCRFEESRLIALAYSGRPNDLSRSFERMRRELHESELDCLPTWRLIVQMAREPRAYVLVAARLRNARIRRRAARGRCWPSSS